MPETHKLTRRSLLAAAPVAGAVAASSLSSGRARAEAAFDPGPVRHILPSVTHNRLLVKVSLIEAQGAPPRLTVNEGTVVGRQTDTDGEHFTFDLSGLRPGTTYELRIRDKRGDPVTSPWPLRTFPHPASMPRRFRLACITCAGGRDEFIDPRPNLRDPTHPTRQFQPLEVKRRLLARALQFGPDAMHVNGDHVYWDMRSIPTGPVQGMSPQAAIIGPGYFDRTVPIKGTRNEGVLKNAFAPQIADLYGVDWRSTPVYFVEDDHDYTENDEARETGRTFPPDTFMRDVSRTTQEFFYPELFPGAGFPNELLDNNDLCPDYGTLRYGALFEGLIYNAKGRMNNTRDPHQPDYNHNDAQEGHPDSRMVPSVVEDWLLARTRTTSAAHYAHIPSSPILWGAGKFAEWYPDVLGDDGHLSTSEPKPYWPDGWNRQHDRLVTTASARADRIPLWISGDLHASALGAMNSTNGHDLSANPVVALCCGTPGTGTPGFPSSFRGVVPEPSRTVSASEIVTAVEENGFSLVDFTQNEIVVAMFRWNHRTQLEEEIDHLEPFAVHRFHRRG